MSTQTVKDGVLSHAQYLQIAEMFTHGNLDRTGLDTMAQLMVGVTQGLANSSTNTEEFHKKCQTFRQALEDYVPEEDKRSVETIRAEYRHRKELFLKKLDANPSLAATEEEARKQAMQESIEEAKRLRAQVCQTCKTKNYSFIENGELKHLLQRCSRCSKVLYCSTNCQRTDWPRHKTAECLSNRP